MTSKERFLTAINRGQPDRVPMFDFLFQEPLYEKLIGHRPGSYNGMDALELAKKLNHDGIWVPLAGFQGYSPEWIDEKTYKDEWGTTFVRSDVSWPIDSPIAYPITCREDFEKYVCPNPLLPGRDVELRQTIANNLTCGVQGPLTTAWLLMGFENISFSLYDDPDLLESVFAMSNDFFKKAAKVTVECGVDGIWVSEDLGDSNSVFFRKEMYVEHFYPYLKDLVDYVDSLGVPALLPAAHRGYGHQAGQKRIRRAVLHNRQHRFVAHAALRNERRRAGRSTAVHRGCGSRRRLCARLRPFAPRRHFDREHHGDVRRGAESRNGNLPGLSPPDKRR